VAHADRGGYGLEAARWANLQGDIGARLVPLAVNENAVVVCPHGGVVTLIPSQTAATADGGALMCEPDLEGAPIVGCAQQTTPTPTAPCTFVVSVLPGSTSLGVTASGLPVYIETLVGITDGVPPAVVTVVDPGQGSVVA
jgi:hypothetical protein